MSEKYLFIYSTANIDGSLKVSFCRHFENLTLTQESDHRSILKTLMGVPFIVKNLYYELNFSCMLYRILLQYFVRLALIIVEITAFIQTDKLKETLKRI